MEKGDSGKVLFGIEKKEKRKSNVYDSTNSFLGHFLRFSMGERKL